MFEDREILHKEDSPDGEWSLHIYGPSKSTDSQLPEQSLFYASFWWKRKDRYTAVPFGHPADPAEISIEWRPSGVCAVYIGDDCYVLFRYGQWKFAGRELFRQAPDEPFSAEEIEAVEATGRLPK